MMGVGRASSHREKMAVMETVVSTTMSHPNIVQVYTYVLQPLMQGCLPSNKKQQGANSCQPKLLTPPMAGEQDAQQQHRAQQQYPQRESREHKSQRQFWPWQQKRQPQHALMAAAAVNQQQQLQEGSVQLPLGNAAGTDPGSAVHQLDRQFVGQSCHRQHQVAQDVRADGHRLADGVTSSMLQQPAVAPDSPYCSQSCNDDSKPAKRNDSSQSLPTVQLEQQQQLQQQDIKHLTPEMAAAAAAALPAAAAAAVGNGNSLVSQHNTGSSGSSEAGGADGIEAAGPGPVLVGWELRLVMEFCDAVGCQRMQQICVQCSMHSHVSLLLLSAGCGPHKFQKVVYQQEVHAAAAVRCCHQQRRVW
jgi:hypothetical protein